MSAGFGDGEISDFRMDDGEDVQGEVRGVTSAPPSPLPMRCVRCWLWIYKCYTEHPTQAKHILCKECSIGDIVDRYKLTVDDNVRLVSKVILLRKKIAGLEDTVAYLTTPCLK